MRWTRWIVCVLVGATVAGSAWLATRRRETEHERFMAGQASQRAMAQRAFGLVPTVPLASVSSAEELAAVLGGAGVEDDPGSVHTAEDFGAVVREVAGLLWARHGQTDARRYIAWRTERGYSWRDRAVLLDGLRERTTYRACTGAEPGDDQDLPALFAEVWACHERHAKPYSRPRAIASDGGGLTLTFGRLTLAGRARQYPRPRGSLGEDVWHAPPLGTPVSWFEPRPDGLTIAKERGSVRSATLGIVVECEDGSRLALHVRLIQRPSDGRWMIDMISRSGYEHPDTSALF
ncbi:MAG: hypothetical protein JNK35_08405 [Phycisphaerae bacterium]|nr:hypothetical protein [Phycisphaerae bacterium]